MGLSLASRLSNRVRRSTRMTRIEHTHLSDSQYKRVNQPARCLTAILILLAVFADHSTSGVSVLGGGGEMATLGGVRDSKGAEIEDLARFAVQEHNKKENALLELARVVKAREQLVAGTLHHLTLEVIDAGNEKLYEAKVWVKPWLNFKELQEFVHVPHFTSSDLGAHKGELEGGWREVPAHDPEVHIAADHAIKTIQQRSNSLAPYALQEILHAKADVNEGLAKFDMLLHVKRGSSEEKYKVMVQKNDEGSFHLNHMELHQD